MNSIDLLPTYHEHFEGTFTRKTTSTCKHGFCIVKIHIPAENNIDLPKQKIPVENI